MKVVCMFPNCVSQNDLVRMTTIKLSTSFTENKIKMKES